MSDSQHKDEHLELFEKLNSVGPGFCLAQFYNLGLHLETGRAHSCIHPLAHLIPVEEIKNNHHALHNDQYKKSVRHEMLNGGRPKECGYCWRLEDANPDIFSDRVHFSMQYNPDPTLFSDIVDKRARHDYYPKNLEISFSTTCNFKCSYCGPAVSSQWQRDLEKNGPYKHRLWSLEDMIKDNEMPIDDRDQNPYVDAFWQWLPEAYPHLWSLRITGGEPLLNPNTFRVVDCIRNHKNKNLEF